MTEKPIDHERNFRITKLLKGLDLEDKEIALSVLSNILTINVQVGDNQTIVIEQQEVGGEPGFTVANNGRGLQIFIPRDALDPDRVSTVN